MSSYHLKQENVEWYYQGIKSLLLMQYSLTPSSQESLADYFIQAGKKLTIPVIFTSSETLYSYQREKIEKVFSSRIIDWYGNAKRTIAIKKQEDSLYDQVPLYSVNEFAPDHIINTSLINSSFVRCIQNSLG
ncbi:hypothetical protein WJR50_03925 [Catalinimonas sp. 4WD22]|uniref:hypothetical protein n=1 Tax=Catalinimonas locisalis TaxID=3133978 RepID=UPI00310147BA